MGPYGDLSTLIRKVTSPICKLYEHAICRCDGTNVYETYILLHMGPSKDLYKSSREDP